ncbi:MAG: protein arginine kinase [Fibrobacteres bacterium]|nr:protein arginine kinase [Fibrobacterota bacterium]
MTRVLCYRNFSGLPFVVSAPPNSCEAAADKALDLIAKRGGRVVWRLAELPLRAIRLLREREILPVRSISFPGKRGFKYLAASPDGGSWLLVNEVEHATFGRILPGAPSPGEFEREYRSPEEGPGRSPWSWTPAFGYLASDPSRIGPGLTVELIVHLPGLALSRQLPHARNYLQAVGAVFLPIRSHSPHSATPGAAEAGLFRLASRGGLGKSAREVYVALLEAVEPVLRLEYEARNRCRERHPERLEARVRQSLRNLIGPGPLAYADLLSAGSLARLGAGLGFLAPQIPVILEELRVTAGSGHLSVSSGRELSQEEEDFTRSNVVRSYLDEHGGEIH